MINNECPDFRSDDMDTDSYSDVDDSSISSYDSQDIPSSPPPLLNYPPRPGALTKEMTEALRMEEIKARARLSAITAVYQRYFMKLHALGRLEETRAVYEEEQTLTDELAKDNKTVWITVNPKPEAKLKDLTDLMAKFVTKKWVTSNFAYTFEQRGDTAATCGTGFHCHLVIEDRGKKIPSEITRETKKHFNKITDISNSHCLNIQFIPHKHFNDKIDYLKGLKWDEDKTPKLQQDKEFRRLNDLKDIYSRE